MLKTPSAFLNSQVNVGFLFILLMVSSANIVSASEAPIDFTVQEKAYIEKGGAIKMCVDPDWAPFERINPLRQDSCPFA